MVMESGIYRLFSAVGVRERPESHGRNLPTQTTVKGKTGFYCGETSVGWDEVLLFAAVGLMPDRD
jgi:hypothetical protein